MARYNKEFESQIVLYRRQRKLLVANNIKFRAPRADFKRVCREKLSQPASVRFFWRAANHTWQQHPGWVMLAFDVCADSHVAEKDLEDFWFRGRKVGIKRASKIAHPPRSGTSNAPVTATTAPAVTTTPATTTTPAVVASAVFPSPSESPAVVTTTPPASVPVTAPAPAPTFIPFRSERTMEFPGVGGEFDDGESINSDIVSSNDSD